MMPQQQPPQQQQQQQQRSASRLRLFKLCVFILLFYAIVLAALLLFLQQRLATQQRARAQAKAAAALSQLSSKQEQASAASMKTYKPFVPHTLDELHVIKTSSSSYSARYQSAAGMYWQQAQAHLAEWDPNALLKKENQLTLLWEHQQQVDALTALTSLQRAAELGHADAQFYASMAYWSGIWPITGSSTTTLSSAASSSNATHRHPLKIMSDWWNNYQQHTQAALWLHMAAMAGHEEAAIALALKMEHSLEQKTATSTSTSSTCFKHRLPYAQAAADIIVDRLQASPQYGRAKVLSASDKHVLYQLHLHGASKFLEAHNQPDESLPALQFYQVRASASDDPQAAQSAFTLAHLYHTGARGVSQNLTQALHWYQVAAKLGHVEAAGHAGDFWLYGIGLGNVDNDEGSDYKPDPYVAYKWYQKGLPFTIEGCRRVWELKLAKKESTTCDATCLNGMGVLLLLGLPMMVKADMGAAEKYFELAKEQGKPDAAYNLAMMKLGWKTHWRTQEEAKEIMVDEPESASSSPPGASSSSTFDSKDGMFAGMPKYSLTRSEWQAIVTDLATAAGAGHVQARHRLAKLYAHGVQIQVPRSPGQSAAEQLVVIPQDCEKALKNFKWIMEHASLHRKRRLRKAYKQYMAGDNEGSLRNYLVAAETGSDLAQLNAAFLLEQGTCLGLSEIDCAKAAVRLYKAAAARGHGEASLRVGDFYYYGRFRDDLPSGPFGWLQYVLYPEKYVGKLWAWVYDKYYLAGEKVVEQSKESFETTEESETDCPAGDASCRRLDSSAESSGKDEEHSFQHDMEMAAHYYRFAAEKSLSMRANFNLGFLYEWGLGLKQDFPLAKRHYDLAISTNSRVSDLPVSIALFCLSLHEKTVKLYHVWNDWRLEDEANRAEVEQQVPRAAESKEFGRPVPPSAPDTTSRTRERQMEILLEHLLSLESLLILVLTLVLWILMQRRLTRRRR